MIIKIHGERNSGTNFLEQLLEKNTNCVILPGGHRKYKGIHGWKHGIPELNKFREYKKEDVLFVCIIRELESWIKSMWNNPYNMKINKYNKIFFDFFTKNFEFKKSKDTRKWASDLNIEKMLHYQTNYNLFEQRYIKYNSYKDIINKYNVILINLNFLQNNKLVFLNFLQNNYNIKLNNQIDLINKHTKPEKCQKDNYSRKNINRSYDINIDLKDFQKYIDTDLENEINNLTISNHKLMT